MKKFIYIIATVLLASACQQDLLDMTKGGSTVTFTVSVPEIAGTKTMGDGENINNLVFAVYMTNAENLADAQASMSSNTLVYQTNPMAKGKSTAFTADGKTNVSLELVNDQKYIVLFWAQVDQTWVSGENFDLTNIAYPKVEGQNVLVANSDVYSAFSGAAFVKKVNGTRTESVNLTRPFAQLNIVSTDPKDYDVTITQSSVKVHGAAANFNVATQTAGTAITDVEYTLADNPTGIFSTEYPHYIASNYLFANGTIGVEYTIVTENHGTIENYDSPITNVPVAKNYRTNILGNLLTSDIKYDVTLDKTWPETAKEVHPLYLAAAVGGEYTLDENVDLTQESIPLVVTSNLTLNLNGFTLKGGKPDSDEMTGSDISAIVVDNGATLTIEGEGIINGSEYGVYVKNGNVLVKSGNITAGTSAVQVYKGTANIEGGNFSATKSNTYVINCIDSAWTSGEAQVNIAGGTFANFDPQNNAAEGAGTNFCAEGYKSAKIDNTTYLAVTVNTSMVTNSEEFEEGFAQSGTILMLNDVELNASLIVTDEHEVHLNMNGKTITVTSESVDPVFKTTKGSTLIVDGNGKVELASPYATLVWPAGNVVIENGTYTRNVPKGTPLEQVGAFFMGISVSPWGSQSVVINGGYFDGGYYDENAADVDEILAGTKTLEETEDDIAKRGNSKDANKVRVALKNNVSKNINLSSNLIKIYGGTFVGVNPAWGDEGCMLPTKPQYLRPWSYYQGALIDGQTFHEDGIVLPDGFTITKGTHEDGRPTYTVTYSKQEN